MLTKDFHFELPDELIARYPLAVRSSSRLLCLDRLTGVVRHRHFADLSDLLQPGDLLVLNDTRVIPARLFGQKETGGRIELLVERLLDEYRVLAHCRASKSPKAGGRLQLGNKYAEVEGRIGELFVVRFAESVLPLLDEIGHMPLPPYIDREDELSDRERYQTVYGDKLGAVAAPTAGLHFDQELLARLKEMGVETAYVTLHVGAGTFQPVRVETITEHHMHSEWIDVPAAVCEQIKATKARGNRVIAVGTTAVRCLETAAKSGEILPYQGDTSIFIYPGYKFQIIDCLLTNFHLPESSLIMLVSALAGHGSIMAAYAEAIAQKYRFFSYGDAMFIA